MSDPVEDWFYKYFTILAGGASSGILAAMAWFRTHRMAIVKQIHDLDTRTNEHIESVEANMNLRFKDVSDDNEHCYQSRLQQSQDIAVLKNEQRNTAASIQDIKISTRDTNIKLDDLILELRRRH